MAERNARGHFVAGNIEGRGRPKGSERAVRRLGRPIISPGETPLEFLLKTMRNEQADTTNRVSAAVACLPYVHAKRRHDATSFVFPTPTSAAEATAILATLPAKIASEGLDPQIAMAITASLRAYLDAHVVSELEAKMRTLIEARKGNGAEEKPDMTREELETRIIDLRPNPEDLQ
jgi:energy-converting hydrogenase Eha subunit A